MSLLEHFDKYVFTGIPAGAAWEAIKVGWQRATHKSWEQLYLQAFKSARQEYEPRLRKKYEAAEITWDEQALTKALRQDLGLRPDTLSPSELERREFIETFAQALETRAFIVIDDKKLGREDYHQLIRNVIGLANAHFRTAIRNDETAFREAVQKELAERPDQATEVIAWLEQNNIILLDIQRTGQKTYKKVEEVGRNVEQLLDRDVSSAIRIPLQRPPRVEHFTDRKKALAKLLADLQPGRAVVLCGPGGIGKTALAAEAIWRLAPGPAPPDRFPDGILFHSFYNQPQTDLALEAIARAFGGKLINITPYEADQQALAGRQALLILDGAEEADDLPKVQQITGGCGVLVTSRQKRGTKGERRDMRPLKPADAMELLQAWGKEQASDSEAAGQICTLVGYLPLAVRLAGRYLDESQETAAEYLAWLKETPLDALNQGQRRLESVPVLLERSMAQVSETARQIVGMASLLAFAPFRREIVEWTLELDTQALRRPLAELANYGLLLREGERCQLSHALIHTYARERLILEAGVTERLIAIYTALAQQFSQQGLDGFAVLDSERVHLMYLLTGCTEREAWQQVIDISAAIDGYMSIRGHTVERRLANEYGLEAVRQLGQRQNEGVILGSLGLAYSDLGQVEEAIEYHKQALEIDREIGYRQGEANQLGNLGNAYYSLGQVEEAIEYYEQALAIHREIGYRQGEAAALGNLGLAYSALGQVEEAIEYYEQALAIHREIGYRQGEANQLGNLGNAYYSLGQVEEAIEYYEQALAIHREIGYRQGEAADLGNLGLAYSALGQVEEAIEYYEQALAIHREIGYRQGEAADLGNLGLAYSALGQVEEAIEYYEQALEIDREIGYRQGEAADLGNLGNAYSALGQVEEAIEYHKQALAIHREIGYRQGEAADLGNLGNAYRALGQVEEAIEYHKQALAIHREIGYRQGEAADLGNLGLAYSDLGQVTRAREYLQQSLAIFEEIKSPYADWAREMLAELED